MKKLKKKVLALIMAALLVVSLAACGGGGGNNSSSGNPSDSSSSSKTTLNFGITSEPSTLDPSLSPDFMTHMMQFQLYDCLVYVNQEDEIVPGLAESWETSEDGLTYTFKIREGVKFHNGDTLTAEDVAFSLNNAMASPMATRMTGHMESAEVTSDGQVALKLKYAYPSNLFTLSTAQLSIVNKAAYEADPDGFARNPVGTGPYQFVAWNNGEKIVMKSFPDYYRGEATIKDLTFAIYTDGTTGGLALENGEIDCLNVPPVSIMRSVEDAPNLTWYKAPGTSTYRLWMNCGEGIFSDVRVRQAVAKTINREDIVIGALEGQGEAVACMVAPSVFGYTDISTDTMDIEGAKALLAEAGYPDGFTTTLKISDTAASRATAEIIQSQLAPIGITVEIQIMERGAYLTDVTANGMFELAVSSLSSTIPDADFWCYQSLHSQYAGVTNMNYIKYQNPEVDDCLERARASQDQEERAEIYKQMFEILFDEAVGVTLYANDSNFAAHSDLQGAYASPMYRYYVYDLSWK